MTSVKNAFDVFAMHEQNPHMARAQADVDLATPDRLLSSSFSRSLTVVLRVTLLTIINLNIHFIHYYTAQE